MLATLTALQLLLLAQAGGAPPAEPGDPAAAPPAQAEPAPPAEAPLPSKPARPAPPAAEPGPSAATTAQPPAEAPLPSKPAPPAAAAAAPAPRKAPAPPKQLSLLSAEPLHGGSAGLAWAGWSRLGAAYAVGFSDVDDLGVFLDYDWERSESFAGLFYRRPLGPVGPFDLGARVALSVYWNYGATYFFDSNHSDRGVDLNPGLVLSQHVGGGILGIQGEVPVTYTGKYKAGILFRPRITASFEAPFIEEATLGVRLGAGYRAGAGDAPLQTGRGELLFLVVAGYQLL
jgi:hypothetical protein